MLTGTLLRAGEQLRVSTQLVEAPDGTLVWSQTSQLPLGDLFTLQDDLASRIVESLSLPLTTREQRMLKHDVPASAKAYEFYLRANQLATNYAKASLARDLYLECLQEDPRYAPAWARLGRVYRVLAKFLRHESRREPESRANQRSFGRSRSTPTFQWRTTSMRISKSISAEPSTR